MSHCFARYLMLVCGLIVAMPSGWCCVLPSRTIETASAEPLPECCRPQSSTPSEAPMDTPAPVRACCCNTVDSALLVKSDSPQPDRDGSLLPVRVEFDRPHFVLEGETVAPGPPSRSLQVLQCVWRC